MKKLLLVLAALVAWPVTVVRAADEVVTSATFGGEPVPFVLTTAGAAKPRYAVILMPGSTGNLSPRMENGKVVMSMASNFLIRSRGLFADGQFVAASTSATSTPGRILAIVQELEKRYGKLAVYVIGTSRSTESTQSLAASLDGQVAGFVHTSSVTGIASFDPHRFKSRQLLVIHREDACKVTNNTASEASHRSYGTDLIVIEGGKAVGDECGPYGHHGYYGVEKETVDRIKAWILAGG